LIEGEFPNYRQLLPEQYESRLTVSRQQLIAVWRRVGRLARHTSPVRLEFNALGVKLSSSSPDLGQAVEAVEARYEGDDITAAVNPNYLADGLAAAAGESVRLEGRDGLKPGSARGEAPELPRGRARRRVGRIRAARGARRPEAGDRPGRVRRVHVPRDAGEAADAG